MPITKDRTRINLIYEIFMAVLALVVVAILFVEFTRPLTAEQQAILDNIDLSILIVFAVDYFYRLIRAHDKWYFFKRNIFDLVAIMPFDKAFRVARLARLVRLARLSRSTRLTRVLRFSKVVRIFAFSKRIGNTFSGVLKTNGLIYVVLLTVGIVLLGAVGIFMIEEAMVSFGDALWWSLVTTTTVGYGDISPESTGGRLLAGFLMIVGIGFLGMVTGSIATFFVDRLSGNQEKEKVSVVDKQIDYVKQSLDGIEDLSNEEVEYLLETIRSIRSYKTNNKEQDTELLDVSE